MARDHYAAAPLQFADLKQWVRLVAGILNGVLDGKTNNLASVTLRSGQTTTTLTDPRITADSAIFLSPRTANAAGALATTYLTPAMGSATLTHANAGTTDRTFDALIVG